MRQPLEQPDSAGLRMAGRGSEQAGACTFAANGFGLYDMVGNVWEWTEDCWNPDYKGAPADGSPWMSGDCDGGSVRGGSCFDDPVNLQSANFARGTSGSRNLNLGFRVRPDAYHQSRREYRRAG